MPVSYTHLDVYKRQVPCCLAWLTARMSSASSWRSPPVSYTHLDVYKRQASTNVDFVPPAFGGVTFTSTHEHYVPIAGGAFTAPVFADIKAELLEHGHLPPYNAMISMADETTVRGLAGFVPVAQMGTNYANTVSLASFGPDYRPDGYNLSLIHI